MWHLVVSVVGVHWLTIFFQHFPVDSTLIHNKDSTMTTELQTRYSGQLSGKVCLHCWKSWEIQLTRVSERVDS